MADRWATWSSWPTCRRLLPDHPWLGEPESHRTVLHGETWVVLADIIAWRLGETHGVQRFMVDRLATLETAPVRAVPLPQGPAGRFSERRLLPAGTLLRVTGIGGYVDFGCAWPGVGSRLEYELPGGTVQIILKTYEEMAETRDSDGPWFDDVTWSEVAAAAVIVPASHPYARNPALVGAALRRIDKACRRSAGRGFDGDADGGQGNRKQTSDRVGLGR